MIRLYEVSKTATDEKSGPRVFFDGLEAEVPTDRRVAILSRDKISAGLFLHLLAGSENPDRGLAERDAARPSPIVHIGASLVSQLSGAENIAFFARLHGVEPHRLLEVVDAACKLGSRLYKPVRQLEVAVRRELEAALIATLPYDCYLVDGLDQLSQHLQWRFFHATSAHKSGLIFSSQLELASRFGEYFVVIRDRAAQVFEEFAQAAGYYEREH
jgi:ABC-type polysaccharide/polyol phosphate transport system ATPase subunit